jgi:hypothetical protein
MKMWQPPACHHGARPSRFCETSICSQGKFLTKPQPDVRCREMR